MQTAGQQPKEARGADGGVRKVPPAGLGGTGFGALGGGTWWLQPPLRGLWSHWPGALFSKAVPGPQPDPRP